MNEKRRPVSGAVENALHGLHKGAGIRRPDLGERLGHELREIWGITDRDPAGRVRAAVVLRLKPVLDALGDDDLAFVIWTAYNLGVTPSSDTLEGRFKILEAADLKKRTCQRRVELFVRLLVQSVAGAQPELADRDLREAQWWLEHNIRPMVEPARRADPGDKVAGYVSVLYTPEAARNSVLVSSGIDAFLAERSYAPAAEDGSLLSAELGDWGAWLCVFTDSGRLGEYRAVAGKRWPRIVTATGSDFVRHAHARSDPTGVLINPDARRGAGVEATLPLPPAEIARLAGGSALDDGGPR
jgi:hypothetical protein